MATIDESQNVMSVLRSTWKIATRSTTLLDWVRERLGEEAGGGKKESKTQEEGETQKQLSPCLNSSEVIYIYIKSF